tara:strand:- start:86 stop:322 length:237 start_codon:yes stop_codon:yes gene_type:complete
MKRSDAITYLGHFIERLHDKNGDLVFDYYGTAEEILEHLEGFGMMPPKIRRQEIVKVFDGVFQYEADCNEWEPEKEVD